MYVSIPELGVAKNTCHTFPRRFGYQLHNIFWTGNDRINIVVGVCRLRANGPHALIALCRRLLLIFV